MSYRKIFILIGMLGSIALLACSIYAKESKNKYTITCEDGDHFIVQAKDVMETNNPIRPQEDLVVVDTQKFRLTFYRDGKKLKSYPVAIGDPDTPSPIGEWKVIHKGGNWGDGFGVRWIGINVPWGIYGIHGTNKPWSIGSRSSHGCIRMYNQHVVELYNLIKLGTPVHIIGSLPKVSPRREVARNNTGRDIIAFQFALRKAGFDPGAVDGRFGPEMELAVLRMQSFYGLTSHGKISSNEQIILGIRDVLTK